jgi:DNA-binding transcriptional ArsR family regulator
MSRAASHDSVFQAIACPTRRALLDALVLGESNVSQLVNALDVTQSAVSQQLAILKSAGLVDERAEGRYRAYVERQLDALGRVLDAMPDEPQQPVARPKRKRR